MLLEEMDSFCPEFHPADNKKQFYFAINITQYSFELFLFLLASSSIWTSWVSMIQKHSAEPDVDNFPQAETLCSLHRMLFLVLENRFRHV